MSADYSVMYGYVRSRQLEGTYNSDPTIGVWPITSLRVAKGWGDPGENKWPYDGSKESWPPKEPAHMDQYAKGNRIFAYQRIRTIDESKTVLYRRGSFVVSVDMTKEWHNAKNGEIPLPKNDGEIIAGHGFCVFGYDDHKQQLKFVNSWGVEWGDKGYGYLPYAYFEQYMTEAWMDVRVKQKEIEFTQSRESKGGTEIIWRVPSVLHGYLFGTEIKDSKSDDCKSWAFASEYDGFMNVEELFVKPKYRGKGYSKQLISSLEELSNKLSVPLRFWISHPDSNIDNMQKIITISDKRGWCLSSSGVRWADYKIETDNIIKTSKVELIDNSIKKPNKIMRPSIKHDKLDSLPDIGLLINGRSQK